MTAGFLQVRGMSKSFGGNHAVRDVSFEVRDGEIVGLIGPNGAGKTTCFNLITGFYAPDAGSVHFRDEDVTALKPYQMARRGIVRSFQKTNILKGVTVFENVLAGQYLAAKQSLWRTFFPGRAVARTEAEARERAAEIVRTMGLAARMNAPASLLACGELRLLEVALALAARPAVLMLDEPAAGLNSHEAQRFGEVLRTLPGRWVQSVLIVEHNMGLVMGVCDRVVVMNFGQKLAEGRPAQVQADASVIEAYLGGAAPGAGMSDAPLPARAADHEPLLAIEDLHVAYGKTAALHGIHLTVGRGETVALIGGNGAGKSTTLRAISGLLAPTRGHIRFKGRSIVGCRPDQVVRHGVAHSPEERHVWPAMSVAENLALGGFVCQDRHELARRIDAVYTRFPRLRERRQQLAGTLSGGEQQMLAIGRALMSGPELLLLDEPSLGLSPRMAQEVFEVVRELNAQGVTILLVEQNVHNALSVATRAYVYETGRITVSRPARELRDDHELLAAYLGGRPAHSEASITAENES